MALSPTKYMLLALVVLCSFQYVYPAESVPVFMWGDVEGAARKANPLEKLNGEDFEGILSEQLDNEPFTVIFIDETLSVEDLAKKDAAGKTLFQNLHARLDNSIYLPSVSSALHTINRIADPSKIDRVKLTEDGLSADIQPDAGKFLFINLKDAREDESRDDLLKRHDAFMADMYNKLHSEYKSVVAIYTAHYPSWIIPEDEPSQHRYRRNLLQTETPVLQTETPVLQTETPVVVPTVVTASQAFNASSLVLFYVASITVTQGTERQVLTEGTVIGSKTENGTTMTLNFTNNVELRFHFTNKLGYWYLTGITFLNGSVEEPLSSSEVFALEGFSYHCSETINFKGGNNTHTVSLKDFQIQTFANGDGEQFGDAFDCIGFTSMPIWSGLFVTFLLLSIMFFGITMMMDIRTMDRFDDPKGKTITINTSE